MASLLSLYFLLQSSSKYKLSLRHLRPDGSIIYAIYQTGLPSVFMNIVFGLIVIFYNHILSDMGTWPLPPWESVFVSMDWL